MRAPSPGLARAIALPADWRPPENAERELRRGRPDLTDADIERETLAFRLHRAENASTSFNHDAAWHRWMLRARHEENVHGQQRPSRADIAELQRHEGLAAGIASLVERRREAGGS